MRLCVANPARIRSVSDRSIHGSGLHALPLFAKDPGTDASEPPFAERAGADADDAILARAAFVGQVWAQREIWFRFAPMVYGLFRRVLRQRPDHDDLTQEVFLRVFRKLHTLEKASALRSFVYSVAVRVLKEEFRRFHIRRRIAAERPDLATPAASSPSDFEMRETLLCVQRTLDGMRDKYRAVFILRHVDGMDLQEIASGLGISLATVKRYLAKALASIHKAILQEERLARAYLGAPAPSRLFGGRRQ
jgi:RNA polymerase sigma-70 factor (ECF subfamily)